MKPEAILSLAKSHLEASNPDPQNALELAVQVHAEAADEDMKRHAAVLVGRAHVMLEQWSDAIAWLDGIETDDAQTYLGWAQHQVGFDAKALTTLEKAKPTAQTRLYKGFLLMAGQADEAVKVLRTVDEAPYQGTAELMLAVHYREAGDVDASVEMFRAAVRHGRSEGLDELEDLGVEPGDDVATQLEAANNTTLEDAEQRLEVLLERSDLTVEQRVDALRARCNVENLQGNWDEAVAWRRKVIEVTPDDAFRHMELGLELFNASLDDESEQAYKRAIELGSTRGEAEVKLAELYVFNDRSAEAEALMQEVIPLRPCDGTAHFNLCQALLNLERLEESRMSLDHSAGLGHPTAQEWCEKYNIPQPVQWFEAAHTYIGEDYEQAIEHYQKAAQLWRPHCRFNGDFFSRNLAMALSNCGYALFRLDRMDEAETMVREALELRPGLRDAWNHLGNILEATDRFDEALAAFRRCASLDGRYTTAPYGEAGVLNRMDRPAEALEAIERALAIGYEDPAQQEDLEQRHAAIKERVG